MKRKFKLVVESSFWGGVYSQQAFDERWRKHLDDFGAIGFIFNGDLQGNTALIQTRENDDAGVFLKEYGIYIEWTYIGVSFEDVSLFYQMFVLWHKRYDVCCCVKLFSEVVGD